MKFKNAENQEKFLRDEKYYENPEDYCLGNTLEEAGEIFRKLLNDVDEKGSVKNVGMDINNA